MLISENTKTQNLTVYLTYVEAKILSYLFQLQTYKECGWCHSWICETVLLYLMDCVDLWQQCKYWNENLETAYL